jgi:hypothetical protein
LAQQAVQVGPVPFATLVKPQPVVSVPDNPESTPVVSIA